MLKSEIKHKCNKINSKIKESKQQLSEIGLAFDELNQESLKPSEICHFLNKQAGHLKYTFFEIKWYMEKHPNIYAKDTSKNYKNKYSEKSYIRFPCMKSINPNKKLATKTQYYIQPPKSKYGIVSVIKKVKTIGANKEETTLDMVYGKKLAESLLEKCIKTRA